MLYSGKFFGIKKGYFLVSKGLFIQYIYKNKHKR